MFFVLSKTLGVFLEPLNVALLLFALALFFRLIGRLKKLRRVFWIAAILWLWVLSTGSIVNVLLKPLETRHVRPSRMEQAPSAIVVLTGMTDVMRQSPDYEFTEAADRFIEGVRLAHRYPNTLLVISGGSSAILDKTYREADLLGRLAKELGIEAKRLRLDRASRNTRENAVESAKILKATQGPILLVTSALHMTRAVACFNKVGLSVVPWPVDYLRTQQSLGAWVPRPFSLDRSNALIHELGGMLFYWISDYI